ncbi:MAG: hypothetical protein AAFQ17_02390, partial [Pseudomonadota bacterium]
MAKTHRLTRFAKPDILRSIDPKLLVNLLAPHARWAEGNGLNLTTSDDLDYDRLALLLIGAQGDVPDALLDLICLIDDMSADRMEDQVRGLAARLKVPVGDEDANADIVVRLALHDPNALAELHVEGLSYRFRTTDRIAAISKQVPKPRKLTPQVKAHLEDVLNGDFERRGRDRTAIVYPIENGAGFRLLISRGDTLKRQGVIEGGERRTRLFRPEEFDLVCYDQKHGDLLVKAKGVTDRRVYCQAIGLCLFGDRFLFDPDLSPSRYSLAPLRERGRAALTFAHIPGVEGAWLERLEVKRKDYDNGIIKICAPNVWELLELFGRPVPDAAVFFRAAIKFKLAGLKRERTLVLTPPFRCSCEQDDHGDIIEQFMDAGGYLLPRSESMREIPP